MGRLLVVGLVVLAGGVALLFSLVSESNENFGQYVVMIGRAMHSRHRRLMVASPQFSLLKPSGSNLGDVPSSSSHVAVLAGPVYAKFRIDATSGIGNNANVRIKLVDAAATHCGSSVTAASAPLDGSVGPTSHSATSNTFVNVRFLSVGSFKICYQHDASASFELLSVTINVNGGISSDEHFCAAASGTTCVVKITGSGFGSHYKLGLVAFSNSASCGTSSLVISAFSNQVAVLVTSQSTAVLQLHNFSLKNSLTAATYLLCLCPGFDADNSGGICSAGSAADFAQPVGKLFVTTVSATTANIFNGLAFNLTVNCGAGLGGCTFGTGSRYKIVDSSTANNVPAWNSTLGCGTALQSRNQRKPWNCQNSVMCGHLPDVPSALAPTWRSILMRSNLRNQRLVSSTFDVCYCDKNCLSTARWFKVGQIQILPVSVTGPSVMNTFGSVELLGSGGAWVMTGDVNRREMKMLADAYGSVSSSQCYETLQSTQLVDGHPCTSTTDCFSPISGSQTQTYINIAVKIPGWVAVCYCNDECKDRTNWFLQGHFLVGGVIPGQMWSFYRSVPFNLDVVGWKLSATNRITVILSTVQCTAAGISQHAAISGPDPVDAQQSGGVAGNMVSIGKHGALTRITFANHHGLVAGARITIAGVTCVACIVDDLAKFNTNHEVLTVLSSTVILVTLSFPVGAYPAVVASSATWVRDDVQTYKYLRASQVGKYHVCWGASATSDRSASATAGVLLITGAPVMTASVHVSTIEPNKTAPIVISFTTANNNRYKEAIGAMQLKVVFLNPSLLRPAFFNGTNVSADPRYDTLEEARQSTCSLWIVELGTARNPNGLVNDMGWPMPRGCYYAKEGAGWAFSIVFDGTNGLKQFESYDIVMNAAVGTGLTTTSEVVEVFSMDDVDHKRYDVIESGLAVVGKGAASVLRSGSDAELHYADGFRILGGTNSMLELSGAKAHFSALLRAAFNKPISQHQIVRVFVRPLTQWVIGYSCTVTCIPHVGRTCGVPLCLTESVMDRWYHRNLLRITFPTGMSNITNAVRHTLNMSSLPTPAGGFFPMRWAVELQPEEGKKPQYVETFGSLLYSRPSATVAAIVTGSGDGNLKPFHGQQGNTLYVKLMLGATLFAVNAGDAYLRIVLPNGFSCTSGSAAPSTLNIFSGLIPTENGNLTNGSTNATWTSTPATNQANARCALRFGEKMVFFAGTTAFFALSVDNPSTTRAQDAHLNRWKLELAAKGAHSSVVTMPLINFSSANSNLSQGVSVLGRLRDLSISPSNFAIATTQNWLSIFFRTAQEVASGGFVQVDSPRGFEVGQLCQVRDLDTFYYREFDLALTEENQTNATPLTLRLPFSGCAGTSLLSSSSINSARVQLNGRLFGGVLYGFELHVINPLSYHPSQLNEWRIYTHSPSSIAIDGSEYTVPLVAGDAPASYASWGMHTYHISPSGFEVHIADMRPSGLSTRILVFPIILRTDANKHLRVIAPAGFVWNFTSSEFVHKKRSAGAMVGRFLPRVEADMPIAQPPVPPTAVPYNILEFKNIVGWFHGGVKYGFQAGVLVPQYTPSSSSNVFILQVGYERLSSVGSQAAVAQAPPVRRITDVVTSFQTSIRNESNRIALHFRTLTEIPSGGGLSLIGPEGFSSNVANASCNLSFATTSVTAVPSQICTLGGFINNDDDNASDPTTASVLAAEMLPASSYVLSITLRNPVNVTNLSTVGSWRIVSYRNLSVPSLGMVDYEGVTPSFHINNPMSAQLVSGLYCYEEVLAQCSVVDQQYQKTGRNDHLGAQSNLIFSFNMTAASVPGQFAIRAPAGFVWATECSVITASSDVFGAFNTIPSNFTTWPQNVNTSNCMGHRNVATFQVSHPPGQGFLPGQRYVFRINWVNNPTTMPADNFWALEFSQQASVPFSGFEAWSFMGLKISPHTTGINTFNSISINFIPRHTVPPLGYLQITAPGGFSIQQSCALVVSTAVPVQAWQTSLRFVAGDYNCTGQLSGNSETNTANIFLLKKSFFQHIEYVLDLTVYNPLMFSDLPGTWTFSSFWKIPWITATNDYVALDTGSLLGFAVNKPIGFFQLNPLPFQNGLAQVDWRIWLQFEEAIYSTDTVHLQAPLGFSLHSSATQCSQYSPLVGLPVTSNATCTTPCYHQVTCVGNTMVFKFARCLSYAGTMTFGICIDRKSYLRFRVATQNPASTPASNSFTIKHMSTDNVVYSSSVSISYAIIPLLTSTKAELVASGSQNVISKAVGSTTSALITFTPDGAGQTLTIQAAVAGESFRFNSVTPKQGTQQLVVNEREAAKIIVTMSALTQTGQSVSILLEGLGNPAQPGTSYWNVTLYAVYDAILGPRNVVNQKMEFPGFEVLGYMSVLTTSTLNPTYYGKTGAILTLNFRSSVQVEQGDEILILAPPNYNYDNDFFNVTGLDLLVETVRLQGSAGVGASMLGTYSQVSDTSSFTNTYTSAGGTLSDMVPIYQKSGTSSYLYRLPGGQQWAIGPTPGAQVSGAVGQGLLVTPNLHGSLVPWQAGTGSGWAQESGIQIYGRGTRTADGNVFRNLSIRVAKALPAAATAGIVVPITLPSSSQTQRSWEMAARRSADAKVYSSNDLQYGGFNLVWEITFQILPTLTAPLARTTMTVAFDAQSLGALTRVRYSLTAPSGFNFPAACLSAAEVAKGSAALFEQCVGSSNVADLISTNPTNIKGTQSSLRVELDVDMPAATPLVNTWSMSFYLDSSSLAGGSGTISGFPITPMAVSMKGNNQLGVNAPAYFTLQPLRTAQVGWTVHVLPPAGQSYVVSCYPVIQVSFPAMPQCAISQTTGALVFTLVASSKAGGGRLDAGLTYTLGFGVTNDARTVPATMNYWSVIVYDSGGRAHDANYEIPGMQLRTLRVSTQNAVVQDEVSGGTHRVTILMTMSHGLAAGLVTEFRVIPPSRFHIGNSTASYKTSLGTAVALSGNNLTVTIAATSSIPSGTHNIEVIGSMHSSGDPDTTWMLQAWRGIEVVYQHVLSGFG